MPYSKAMIDHCENPRNVGSLDENDLDVGTGIIGAPACGDVLKFQIRVKDNRIIETRFKTFGCGGAISSSSLTTEKITGKTLEEALELKNSEIVKELDLPKIKIHCSVMAEQAIRAAINDYRKKQKELKKEE
jgi:nitrogen fixation protein NifU and related proteins